MVEAISGVLWINDDGAGFVVGDDSNEARGASSMIGVHVFHGVGGGDKEEVGFVEEVNGLGGELGGIRDEHWFGECRYDTFAVEVFRAVS